MQFNRMYFMTAAALFSILIQAIKNPHRQNSVLTVRIYYLPLKNEKSALDCAGKNALDDVLLHAEV